MRSRYYYSFDDSIPAGALRACSLASKDYPLTVNCAGNLITSDGFTTDNVQGREDYYYIYVVSGTMNLHSEDNVTAVGAGDVLIFPPRYRYKYTYTAGERLSYLWVHFTGSYVHRFISECISDSLPLIRGTVRENRIVSGFERMFNVFEKGGPLRNQALACALEALLLETATAIKCGSEDRTLERSLRYIHSSYNKDISVEELAVMENMSYFGYIKMFRSRMGIPPVSYIINLRINAACDFLINTDMSIKQVGVSVGYRDPHFFSRTFKKHIGVSPIEYREAASNGQTAYNE